MVMSKHLEAKGPTVFTTLTLTGGKFYHGIDRSTAHGRGED